MREATQHSIAVGFFDGIHLGHRQILSRADAALTFRNHPKSVIDPEHAPLLLMTPEAKAEKISRLVSTNKVLMLDFTPELAAMPAETFARRVFFPESHPEGLKVICGENWRFGAGGIGDADLLDRMGIDVEVVPSVYVGAELVSSTRIRELLAEGRPDEARILLGRNYCLEGIVRRGKGLGEKLGFPTVNVEVGELPIRTGVYLVRINRRPAVANYGYAPTLGEKAWEKPVLEVHFLHARDAAHIHYDNFVLLVSFSKYLRPERKFESLDELRRQLAADVEMANAVRMDPRD